jgi:nucleotide-binding universal stress UspA family protein
MKPILLATDGSPYAAEATLEAFQLALRIGAPLLAITVANVVVPPYAHDGYANKTARPLMELEDERVSAVLEETRAAAEAGLECETGRASGPVVAEICDLARARNARMIVIGAHGWGPIRRVIHGSVSRELVEDAPCPVVVVQNTHALSHQSAIKETP